MTPRYFHVTSSLNRESIERHGLDWRRMGATHGIAGFPGARTTPEVEGIFLVDSEFEIEWFAHMGLESGHESIDVWEVSLVDPDLVKSDEGYPFVTQAIPPESIRLHTADWRSRDPARVTGDFFHAIYYGDGTLDPELLTEDAIVIDVEGRRHQGLQELSHWARGRAHGPPPGPKTLEDGTVVYELGGEGGYSIEGLGDGLCLVSPPAKDDFWAVVRIADNRVAEVREFKSRRQALAAKHWTPPLDETGR
jgi:hypothetical protein